MPVSVCSDFFSVREHVLFFHIYIGWSHIEERAHVLSFLYFYSLSLIVSCLAGSSISLLQTLFRFLMIFFLFPCSSNNMKIEIERQITI
jgi:hypothetical protein